MRRKWKDFFRVLMAGSAPVLYPIEQDKKAAADDMFSNGLETRSDVPEAGAEQFEGRSEDDT